MTDGVRTTPCFACAARCGERTAVPAGPAPAGLLRSVVWIFGLPLLALCATVVIADSLELPSWLTLLTCCVTTLSAFACIASSGRRLEAMIAPGTIRNT